MQHTYTIRQAKANFANILKRVESGEEIIILRGKKPVAKVVAVSTPPLRTAVRRRAGTLKGILSYEPGAFDPLTDEELKDWGIE